LKGVLGHSLEDTAATMATTIPAVKAALFRGRAKLREGKPRRPSPTPQRRRTSSCCRRTPAASS